ncbi:hypothetical protein CERZMDRAFT_46268 [Cercospora zeae-maydis SCOH1-5]|uniref:Alpha/beta hydrolase fold-3 domain-containing protein n=1 Tax=Cercospora zeae-maydis SCOH1-5 TaxID=717836 RepID=A0A6A6F8U7_9PEZI|nr:hypothetical protein CERZMDRAFT_46268 [Cercospora zeae-maydis SCOH1-5]
MTQRESRRLAYDPEFARLANDQLQQQRAVLPVHDITGRRARMASFVAGMKPTLPVGVHQTILHVETADGTKVPVYHLYMSPSNGTTTPTAAVLHLHGGGYIGVSAEDSAPSIAAYVAASSVPIFSVDYRLAPEHPFSVPLEDSWSALTWLQANADRFSIDPERVMIMGESAGGGLAAALAILARDRALSPPIAKQMLIYPMLDDTLKHDHTNGLAIFSVEDVITGWAAYLGPQYGTNDVSELAAASRVKDVSELPPLYIDCGHLDLFIHQAHAYAGKFLQAGVPLEYHVYTGVPHSFHRFAPDASVTKRAFANRVAAMLSV